MNASSTAAIKAALTSRLLRLRGELDGLLPAEEDEPELYDERFEGEHEEQNVLQDVRQIMEDEIDKLQTLLDMKVKRDKKLEQLLGLIDQVAKESVRREEEKVLIFTEYRQTRSAISLRSWKRSTARVARS